MTPGSGGSRLPASPLFLGAPALLNGEVHPADQVKQSPAACGLPRLSTCQSGGDPGLTYFTSVCGGLECWGVLPMRPGSSESIESN